MNSSPIRDGDLIIPKENQETDETTEKEKTTGHAVGGESVSPIDSDSRLSKTTDKLISIAELLRGILEVTDKDKGITADTKHKLIYEKGKFIDKKMTRGPSFLKGRGKSKEAFEQILSMINEELAKDKKCNNFKFRGKEVK